MIESLTILFALAVWGYGHSWLASLRAKALARRWFGPSSDQFYRLAYNLFAVLSLLPALALLRLLPDRRLYAVPLPWAAGMLLLQALAGLAALAAVLQTGGMAFAGLAQLTRPPSSEPGALVTGGLYRYVRHPIYTASLLAIWLTPLMTRNLLALYIGFTLYFVIGAYFEERKLRVEYGEAYRRYQQQTPMFIPTKFKSRAAS